MTETRAIVDDRCNRQGITFKDAAKRVGMSAPTFRKKCNEPVLFNGIELKLLELFVGSQMENIYGEIRRWRIAR